jgi:serine/threonine-protein kinase
MYSAVLLRDMRVACSRLRPNATSPDAGRVVLVYARAVDSGTYDSRAWIGQTIDRYALESLLGEGGFGAVYRAKHVVTGRYMALKVLLPSQIEMADRFLQEAKAAAAVGNKHIVEVTDAGVTPDGRYFLAMELLEGESLESIIQRGPIEPKRAADIAVQVLEGLGAAHAKGIVHRDLKPANIFILRDEQGRDFVKILDFGISKMRLPNEVHLETRAGMALGTPHYMAPEQFRNPQGSDHRVDLHAVAVLMYEMLCGVRPYEGEIYETLIVRIISEPPVPLTMRVHGLPQSLVLVVDGGLQKDPSVRWGSAAAMAAAIQQAMVGYVPTPVGPAGGAIPQTAMWPQSGQVAAPGTQPGYAPSTGPHGPRSAPIAPTSFMHTPAPFTPPAQTPPSAPYAPPSGFSPAPPAASGFHGGAPTGPYRSTAEPAPKSRSGAWIAATLVLCIVLLAFAGIAVAGAIYLSGKDDGVPIADDGPDDPDPDPDTPPPPQGTDSGGGPHLDDQLRSEGCRITLHGPRQYASGYGSAITITVMNDSNYVVGWMSVDARNLTGPVTLSTRHRIDSQFSVSFMGPDGTFSNLSRQGLVRPANDPIHGTVTVHSFDPPNGYFDLEFDDVVVEEATAETRCTINGRVRRYP